ncbi:MAG: alkaline phosphatase family protein [Polyangiaceae bacterium]
MTPETRRALGAALLSVAVGVLVGRALLHSMNAPNDRVLAALTSHADPPGVPPAAVPAGAPDRLVIALIDGLGEEPFREALRDTPLEKHAWEATVDCGTPSLSRAIYHVLLTGVPQSVSGIRNNTHQGPARADDIATRVRQAGGTVGWALQTVPWFHDLAGAPQDPYEKLGEEPLLNPVTDRFDPPAPPLDTRFAKMAVVLAQKPNLAVLHFIEVDHAGHHRGARSPEYKAAAHEAMEAIVALREAHEKTPEGARTVWMLGADHGHLPRGGHGGPEMEVRRTLWIGVWPSPTSPPKPVVVPDLVPATRLAGTFAAILGVAPPRESLGEPLPLPDRDVSPTPALAERREAVTAAEAEANATANQSVFHRTLAVFLALLALAYAHVRGPARREKTLYLLGAVWPVLVASVGFRVLGPGLTLSAIRTHFAFASGALFATALGAALTYPVVKRCRTPSTWLAITAAVPPAAAYAIAAGSMGASRLPDSLLLLFPATGVLPAGVLLGLTLAAAANRLRK